MGQGTSRLNWVCSCEDGKFNLSATYEEQKNPSEDKPVEKHGARKEAPPPAASQNIAAGKDTLLPIMDVETTVNEPDTNNKLRRTYSSCDLVYTKPGPDSKRVPGRQTAKYRSHEVLSSGASSSTNTESSGLSQSNSENSLNSSRNIDSKLQRMFGTSVAKTKREQSELQNKQKISNIQQPTPERKLSLISTTSTGSTDRKSSIGDISSLSELLKKKKKEARRAEIVAAVTRRLYSTRKKVDAKPELAESVAEQEDKPVEEDDDTELKELKLCSNARMKLQELSKKALHAHRVRMKRTSDVEAQTDFDAHVQRVKEVAVGTDLPCPPPSIFFLNDRNLLLTNYAYPSMRQNPPWRAVSASLHNEDNYSDDSLDSNHELEVAQVHKPSLWDVISLSSGKQFAGSDDDDISRNASTQTLVEQCDEEIVDTDVPPESTHSVSCNTDNALPHLCSDVRPNHVDLNNCACDQPQEFGFTTEGTPLKKIDRHLYTITENSELSECNDLSSDNCNISAMEQKPVTVIECFESLASHRDDSNKCKSVLTSHRDMMTQTQRKSAQSNKATITTTDVGSNTDVQVCNQCSQTVVKPKEISRCQQCQYHTYEDLVPRTRTEGVQCQMSNVPEDVCTQTPSESYPNLTILCSTLLGAYQQLLRLSNPNLRYEDCLGVFFSDQTSQPILMKRVPWCTEQASETIAIQTEDNANVQEQMYNREGGIRPHRKTRKSRKHRYQPDIDLLPSEEMDMDAMTPDVSCSTESQGRASGSSSTAYLWDDYFPDEDEAPSLPRSTVASMHGTEASATWTEIKNLILGRNPNMFPYNVMIDDSLPTHPSNRLKKKSVSWSDLSGCGDLHTEMIFTSDHNLYDSSQTSGNKISKSSLLDDIARESHRPSHHRQIMDTGRHPNRLYRRWSMADMKELGNKQVELSTFLREATALVSSLSQATHLLQKGRQLQPYIHNDLWLRHDDSGSISLPIITTDTRESERGSKECNVDAEVKCEEQNSVSLPDCSNLNTEHQPTVDEDARLLGKSHTYTLSSPRAYRQHLVAVRRQIIRASLPSLP